MSKPVRVESWWRCCINADRKVVSATAVEEAGTDGGGVFYVRASSRQEAETAGRAAFNEYQRRRGAANRAALDAQGRCKCGRARDAGGKTCSWCRKLDKNHKERYSAKQRGEHVAPPSWAKTREERLEMEHCDRRRDTLREVLQQFCKLTASDFKRWLEGEIKKLAGRNAA